MLSFLDSQSTCGPRKTVRRNREQTLTTEGLGTLPRSCGRRREGEGGEQVGKWFLKRPTIPHQSAEADRKRKELQDSQGIAGLLTASASTSSVGFGWRPDPATIRATVSRPVLEQTTRDPLLVGVNRQT